VGSELAVEVACSTVILASLDGALDSPSLGLLMDTINFSMLMIFVDLLLDGSDSLIGERLIFEHCLLVSVTPLLPRAGYLQKVNSSSVRLYVSGYMKYTKMSSKVIQPQ